MFRILGRIWVAGLVVVELLDLVLLMVMEWVDKEDGLGLESYEARMWLGGCRTGVRRGPMQGVATDVAACASVPRLSFFFFGICTDSALIHVKPGQFDQN